MNNVTRQVYFIKQKNNSCTVCGIWIKDHSLKKRIHNKDPNRILKRYIICSSRSLTSHTGNFRDSNDEHIVCYLVKKSFRTSRILGKPK